MDVNPNSAEVDKKAVLGHLTDLALEIIDGAEKKGFTVEQIFQFAIQKRRIQEKVNPSDDMIEAKIQELEIYFKSNYPELITEWSTIDRALLGVRIKEYYQKFGPNVELTPEIFINHYPDFIKSCLNASR